MKDYLRNKRINTILCLGVILVTVLLAYGYILRLPLFWDDLWHYEHVTSSWKAIRTNWRPAQFNLYRLTMLIQGKVDPFGQHLLSLFIHLLNGILVFIFVNFLQLPNKKLIALFSAVFFVLYPFSGEAVTWVAALTHPLATCLALGAVIFFIASRRAKRGAKYLWLASFVCAFLAPFANEEGMVVAAFIALVLLLERAPRRYWPILIPYVVCSFYGYYALRRIIPHDNRFSAFQFQDIPVKAAYLLQALMYPLAPLVSGIYRLGIKLDPSIYSIMIYGVFVAIYLGIMYRCRQLRIALFAIGMFIVACIPLFMLNPSYILIGPRLLYFASPWVCLLWALPLSAILPNRGPVFTKVISVSALVGLVLWASIPDLIAAHEMTWQIKTSTDNVMSAVKGKENPILFINFPNGFSLHTPTFLLGRFAPCITPSKSPSDLGDLLYWNGMPGYQITNYTVEGSANPEWFLEAFGSIYTIPHDELVASFRQYHSIFTTEYDDTVNLREIGGFDKASSKPESTYQAQFSSQLLLLDSSLTQNGPEYVLTLRWQCLKPLEHQTQIFVHVYDRDGNLIVGQDQQPLLGLSDLLTWQAGDIWRDVRYITLPEDTAPGDYAVVVGMYTLPDVVRLPAYDSMGQRMEGDVVYLGTITIP